MRLSTIIVSIILSAFILIVLLEGFQILRVYKMETEFTPNAFFEFANVMLFEKLRYIYYQKYHNPQYLFYVNFSFIHKCNYIKSWKLYVCNYLWVSKHFSIIEGSFENVTNKKKTDHKLKLTLYLLNYKFAPFYIITDVYHNRTFNVSMKDILGVSQCNVGLLHFRLIKDSVHAFSELWHSGGCTIIAFPFGNINLLAVNRTGVLYKVVVGEIGTTSLNKKTKTIG